MSDAALRDVAREAASSGDPVSESRALALRLRAGTITMERLEVAGFCGDRGAAMVVAQHPPTLDEPANDWRFMMIRFVSEGGRGQASFLRFLQELTRFEGEVGVRAAYAAACAVPVTKIPELERHESVYRLGLHLLKLWLEAKTPSVRGRRLRPAVDYANSYLMGQQWAHAPAMAAWALRHEGRGRLADASMIVGAFDAARWVGRTNHRKGRPVVRRAIERELIAWALS